MKKIIAILIVFCFIFNCGIVTAFASEMNIDTLEENSKVYNETYDEKTSYNMSHITTGLDDNLNDTPQYVVLSAENTISRLDRSNLNYQMRLNNLNQYEYVKVSFVSTENILLDDYQTLKYDFSGSDNLVNIKFEINNENLSFNNIPTYSEVVFDKIYVIVDAYIDQSLVDSSFMRVSVLNTDQGVFVSEYGDIFAYDNYISYLHTNSLISDEQYKLIQKKATELSVIDTDDEVEIVSDQISIRYYDDITNTVAVKSVDSISEIQNDALSYKSYSISLMSTTTSGTISAPSLTVTRTITSLDSGAQLKIYGYVRWTDIEGHTHPARNIEVQIMDEDITFDDTLATVNTSNNGYYSATIDNQTGINENGCDIYIRVNTKNDNFSIGSSVATSMFSDGYYFTTGVTSNVGSSQSQVTYSGSNSDAFRAVSVQQALVVGYYYYEKMNNDNVNSISVVYPGGTDGSWSNSFWDLLNIEYNDYCDWDVIIHELGHQVATKINVDASFSDSHSGGENLMERYGKIKGIKGAWSEGWATYFSLAAQKYYNSNVVTISNITNVADEAYTDLLFDDSGNYYSGVHRDYSSYVGCGEGNEAAVSYVLFYLVYRSGLTHQKLWNIAKESACDCFSDFIETLYDSVDKSFYTEIGILLEEQNIADSPNVQTSIFSRNTPGTFYWDPVDTTDGASGSYKYHNDAVITFFDENYNIVMESPIHASASGVYGVPINSALWRLLDLEITGDSFYWSIATSQNDNPGTGPYYSTFHKAYFVEDITTIANTNVQYDGYLNAYDDVIYKFVVPSTGTYTFFSTGDTDVNVTVYLNSILEGESITDDDDGEGLNFLYNRFLNAETTVYLRIGGYRNASGSFHVSAIKYTTTSTNTSKIVTIDGKNGVWIRYTAPTTASYTFYTTGDIDVYGDLFSYPIQDGSTNGRLTYNDDAGAGRNFLFTYNLTSNQTVYLRVRGYSSSTTGTSSLHIVATPVVATLDTSYSANLVSNGYTIYKFTAPSAGDYTFYTTGSTDTYMDLFDEPVLDRITTSDRLDYNDDGGTSRNASITYSLLSNQTIFIRIRGYSTSTTGAYCFAIVKSTAIETLSAAHNGNLSSGSMLWYTFTAPKSGDYTIYTTGSTDTYADVFGFFTPDGGVSNLIDSNDDDEVVDLTTCNFRLILSLTKGQTVYIRVRGYSGSITGAFSLYADVWEE